MNGTALYRQLLEELNNVKEDKYAAFHSTLLNGDFRVLGVRVPILRKLAKKYLPQIDMLLEFPNEYYEVKFIKLAAVAQLCFDDFIKVVDICVPLIDNWALCDCFSPKCIRGNKQGFVPYIERYISSPQQFYQRFALTSLLSFYIEESYMPLIARCIERADTKYYYVHMAVAWLVAEVLAKNFGDGLNLLNGSIKDKKTYNKAIQKACESFRITEEQKSYLKGLKQ